MSFISKGLKKAWKFVKKNWKTIALVAAIAFTAGAATIGFAAFAGVSGPVSFLSAVGETMWAGVMGTAGSMGLGSGATIPTNAATIAAGTAGTQVGLGAAWGAGGGYGLGSAGKAAAAKATADAAVTNVGGMMVNLPQQTSGLSGLSNAELSKVTVDAAGNLVTGAGEQIAADVAGKGLSDAAWKTFGVVAPIAGSMLAAAGEPPQYYKTGYWGVDPNSEEFGPGRSALAVPDPSTEGFDPGGTGAAASGPDASAADSMFKQQLARSQESVMQPLMGSGVTGRGTDGRIQRQDSWWDNKGKYDGQK